MLSNFKDFVKHYQNDIFVVSFVFLAVCLAFGAGRFSAKLTQTKLEPIVIQNPQENKENTASIQDIIPKNNQNETSAPTSEQAAATKFVGSKNSNKYHLPECSSAKKISSQNQIIFNSIEEAQKAGYVPCSRCLK